MCTTRGPKTFLLTYALSMVILCFFVSSSRRLENHTNFFLTIFLTSKRACVRISFFLIFLVEREREAYLSLFFLPAWREWGGQRARGGDYCDGRITRGRGGMSTCWWGKRLRRGVLQLDPIARVRRGGGTIERSIGLSTIDERNECRQAGKTPTPTLTLAFQSPSATLPRRRHALLVVMKFPPYPPPLCVEAGGGPVRVGLRVALVV